jgi:hypothetical protein
MVCKGNSGDSRNSILNGMVMSNIYTDKEYFDDKFKTINEKFTTVISRLDSINNNRIPKIEERLGCIEKRNDIDDEIKKRWWVKYKRTLETLGVIIAFGTLLLINWSEKKKTKDLEEKVGITNQILTPEAVKRGFNLDSLGLND